MQTKLIVALLIFGLCVAQRPRRPTRAPAPASEEPDDDDDDNSDDDDREARFAGGIDFSALNAVQDFKIPTKDAADTEFGGELKLNNAQCRSFTEDDEVRQSGDSWVSGPLPRKPPCFSVQYYCRKICYKYYDLATSNANCGANCVSLRKVVRKHCIYIKTPKIISTCQKKCQLDLTYVMDKSGTMLSRNNFNKAQNFFNQLTSNILGNPQFDTQIALVVHGSTATTVQPFTANQATITSKINAQVAGGSDNLPQALTKTKALYINRAGALRAAVVVSDGLMADVTTQANALRGNPNPVDTYGLYTPYDPNNSALDNWGRRIMQQVAGNKLSHFLDTLNVNKVAGELTKMCNDFLSDGNYNYDIKPYIPPRAIAGARAPTLEELQKLDVDTEASAKVSAKRD